MNSYFAQLWTSLVGLATQDGKHHTYVTLPHTGPGLPEIVADEHYFRLRLVDMFLSKGRSWFTNWHPAVTSQVKLKVGGREGTPICRVAAPPKDALSPGVFINYPLTDLLPYRGGEVDVQAGLLGLKGDSAWAMPISLLQRFSGLIGAPLATTLTIAEQVAGGLNDLLAQAAERTHLGFHQAFTEGGATLGAKYHVVIRADDGTYAPSQLSIANNRLRYRPNPGDPERALSEHDYIVIAVDTVTERDDWRLPDIESAMQRAKSALAEADTDGYEKHRRAAIAAALSSPDLVEADRTRVIDTIKRELKKASDALGLMAARPPGAGEKPLSELMQSSQALSRDAALSRGPYSLAEAFAD